MLKMVEEKQWREKHENPFHILPLGHGPTCLDRRRQIPLPMSMV
jgi:hypothetical protein